MENLDEENIIPELSKEPETIEEFSAALKSAYSQLNAYRTMLDGKRDELEKLAKRREDLNGALRFKVEELEKSEAEVKRLREALEKIHDHEYVSRVDRHTIGRIAKEALNP